VHENVIMAIGGWKTRSMFDRYAIVNPDDTRRAMEALAESRRQFDPPTTPLQQRTASLDESAKGTMVQ
jgi:hypothetical protein